MHVDNRFAWNCGRGFGISRLKVINPKFRDSLVFPKQSGEVPDSVQVLQFCGIPKINWILGVLQRISYKCGRMIIHQKINSMNGFFLGGSADLNAVGMVAERWLFFRFCRQRQRQGIGCPNLVREVVPLAALPSSDSARKRAPRRKRFRPPLSAPRQ